MAVPLSVGWARFTTQIGVPRLATVCSLMVASIAAVVLLGWLTHTEALATILPGSVTLKANSALGFLAVAVALAASSRPRSYRGSRVQIAAASAAILVGTLGLLSWAGLGVDIDEIIVRDTWTTAAAHPGRSAVTTAVALILLGAAALPVFDRMATSAVRAALAMVALGIAAAVAMTWVFGTGRLFSDPAIEPASVLSAVCIIGSSVGLIGLSRLPVMSVFLRRGPVGMTARASLATAITLPAILAMVGIVAVADDAVEPVAAIVLMAALGAVLGLMAAGLAASRSAHVQDALDETVARLRTSEERSRTILDQLPDLVLTKDRGGRITWANAAVERTLGVTRTSLVGAPLDGLFPDRAVVALTDLERRVVEERRALSGSIVLGPETANARWMDVRILPVMADADEVGSVLEVLTDVTDAREAQRAQERLAAVVDASQDAIFTLDADGTVTSWNPAAERILGWSVEEVMGNDARSITSGDDADTPLWSPAVDVDGVKSRHARWLTKDGQPITVRMSASALRDSDGVRAGTSIMASDVTEELARELALRESEESLRTATKELARSNDSLRDFASVASHDLKEPLRKIRAFGDRLLRREGALLSDDGRADLARMTGAAERMQDLITDLLDLARVSSTARALTSTPLAEIVNDALDDLAEAIGSSSASIEVGPLPVLTVDRHQLRRVFLNLIGNSLKFHPPDAVPHIEIGADGPAVDAGGEAEVSIWVTDHGVGFDQRFADRIFDPFERLHGRDEFEGTGIGLAICRQIIEGHGGRIEAASEPGIGTRMTITLPQRDDSTGDEGAPHDERTERRHHPVRRRRS